MVSPTDRMFESSSSIIIENPLFDQHNLSQTELSKRKIISKKRQNCINDMYTIANRYHRLKSATINTLSSSTEHLALTITPINQSSQQIKAIMIDGPPTDSIWSFSGT